MMENTFLISRPSVMIFIGLLALFTIGATVLSEGFGIGLISTSFVKTLDKTLCLCLIALATDIVWGYCGILSLGHFAFFGLGGYMIGIQPARLICSKPFRCNTLKHSVDKEAVSA